MDGTAPPSFDWKSNIILLYDIRIFYNTINGRQSQA